MSSLASLDEVECLLDACSQLYFINDPSGTIVRVMELTCKGI